MCWWEQRHSVLVSLLSEKTLFVTNCIGGSHILVCRSHVCPRSGNSWKKGKASLQEYVLGDTRYHEIILISVACFGEKELRALLDSRVLVGAPYHITHTYSSRTLT